MTDDELLDRLRGIAGGKGVWQMHGADASYVLQSVARIEHLSAEVERLTPKEMTLGEACEIMNTHGFLGYCDWMYNRHDIVIGGSSTSRGIDSCPRMRANGAKMVAQGLLRDAGPIAETQEPATPKEVNP